jgi:hypothetical protein
VTDPALREALEGRLRSEPDFHGLISTDPPVGGDVVVLLAREASPFECLGLVNAHIRTVILASRWSAVEQERYAAAGATAYLLVELPAGGLVAALRECVFESTPTSTPTAFIST